MGSVKGFWLIVFSFGLAACSSSPFLKEMTSPESRSDFFSEPRIEEKSVLTNVSSGHTYSIGDELFRARRTKFLVQTVDRVDYETPTNVNLPEFAIWSSSHIYREPSVGTFNVFTTSEFYSGKVGIILDEELMPATQMPLIQVDGAREGRRWPVKGSGPFFKTSNKVLEVLIDDFWALRFGGVSDKNYIFEIINASDSSQFEILQRITISEAEFMSGFYVKEVFIQGMKPYNQGIISARFHDTSKHAI